MATRLTDAASLLPRACIALTQSEEKERLLAVYSRFSRITWGKLESDRVE